MATLSASLPPFARSRRLREASAVKRAFDLLVAVTALISLAPLMVAAAIAVRLESPGPVLFRQQRVGKDGALFQVLKFRTMRREASGQQTTPVPKVGDFSSYVFDPLYGGKQYTRIGRLLRTTSLDELPNLINVLRGEMSIVGPRPEVPELVEQYLPEYRRRHAVRPGITGLAQVSGRGSLTYGETMLYDLEYVDNHSVVGDLMILAKTVPAVLTRKGAQ
ncbi:MAG: sugar transferase [Chloroflexi bacterium]|nr:sugar transferase [Chloroflexota bacterium]